MEIYYLIILILLFVLAISDLMVGVANDAVNFLNSAIGSRVAARHWILLVASVGVLVGAVFSSGMMEIAQKGVFRPEKFYMSEIMTLFMAVILTDVIVLDFFNTFGLPTSTTVSLVFELLGSAVAISIFKISENNESIADLGSYINTAKALAMISGIFISVVIAFFIGTIVQYIARVLFTFNYTRSMKYVGSIWGGISLTAITYFIAMKGLNSTALVSPDTLNFINQHTMVILLLSFTGWTIIFQLAISIFKWNILRFVVLAGTFALALSFAGNDLVNFIGPTMAALKTYQVHLANPGVAPDQLLMTDLAGPVSTNTLYLLIAGLVMVITLWTSRKARTVTNTEVGLANQDSGAERFGSTQLSRSIVRISRSFSEGVGRITPLRIKSFLSRRFDLSKALVVKNPKDAPAFDLVRASVNLVVSSILISLGTSLKLPLSTTYVTFMVAMGTSLSDRAWGRESAVYRVTGVITVIAGWFFTALITFIVSFVVAAALFYWKAFALVGLAILAGWLLIRSNLIHRSRNQNRDVGAELITDKSVVEKCTLGVNNSLRDVVEVFSQTIDGLTSENRKLLRTVNNRVADLNSNAKNFKNNIYQTLKKLEADSVETGHYYVQVVDYLREIAHSLSFITEPSLKHIENQHKGLTTDQAIELTTISNQVSDFFQEIMKIIKNNDFTGVPQVVSKQQDILDKLNEARKNQVKRIKQGVTGTRNSVLYLGLINEIKNIMLHTVNLLKAQRDFILNNVE